MRKNFARIQTTYITLFILAATVAQAGPRRMPKPDLPSSWIESFAPLFEMARRAFDTIRLPIG